MQCIAALGTRQPPAASSWSKCCAEVPCRHHRTAHHTTALHTAAPLCTAHPCTPHRCAALRCAALHTTAHLHTAAHHTTALRCAALRCAALRCAALHCTAHPHTAAHHTTALRCAALHCTPLHTTPLRCAALRCSSCAALRPFRSFGLWAAPFRMRMIRSSVEHCCLSRPVAERLGTTCFVGRLPICAAIADWIGRSRSAFGPWAGAFGVISAFNVPAQIQCFVCQVGPVCSVACLLCAASYPPVGILQSRVIDRHHSLRRSMPQISTMCTAPMRVCAVQRRGHCIGCRSGERIARPKGGQA